MYRYYYVNICSLRVPLYGNKRFYTILYDRQLPWTENEVPTFVFCPWELSYFDFMD